MCALHKAASAFLFVFLFLSPFSFLAAETQPNDPLEKILEKVQAIDERIKRIEANQKEVQDRQQKILEEISNLRVWIRQT